MRKSLALLLLLFAVPAWAQRQPTERLFMRNFNLTTTTPTACASSTLTPSNNTIQTSGSSQTITAVTPGAGTFGPLRALSATTNDHIRVVIAGVENWLTVSTKPNDDTITIVESALTIAPQTFQWITTDCGTTSNVGWLPVGGSATQGFQFEYNAGDWTNGVNMQIQCRGTGIVGGNPNIVYPSKGDTCGGATLLAGPGSMPGNVCQFATASVGIINRLYVGNIWPYSQCRILVAGTAGGGTTATLIGFLISTVGAN